MDTARHCSLVKLKEGKKEGKGPAAVRYSLLDRAAWRVCAAGAACNTSGFWQKRSLEEHAATLQGNRRPAHPGMSPRAVLPATCMQCNGYRSTDSHRTSLRGAEPLDRMSVKMKLPALRTRVVRSSYCIVKFAQSTARLVIRTSANAEISEDARLTHILHVYQL